MALSASLPLTASPQEHGVPIETAGQLEEEEGDAVGARQGVPSTIWMKRLDAIESRQKRIESLLEEIAKGVRK
jgi:hypothetical protein